MKLKIIKNDNEMMGKLIYSDGKEVEFSKANPQYIQRDRTAREAMYALINSDVNKIDKVFSKLI